MYYSYRGWWIGNKECNKENGRPGDGGGRFRVEGCETEEADPRAVAPILPGIFSRDDSFKIRVLCSSEWNRFELFLRSLPIFFPHSPTGTTNLYSLKLPRTTQNQKGRKSSTEGKPLFGLSNERVQSMWHSSNGILMYLRGCRINAGFIGYVGTFIIYERVSHRAGVTFEILRQYLTVVNRRSPTNFPSNIIPHADNRPLSME